MKNLFLTIFLFFSSLSMASADYNSWVLKAIEVMPRGGGYELTSAPVKRMRDAFSWSDESRSQLLLDPKKATPSYCTTATYMVFYQVLYRYWEEHNQTTDILVLERLKPNLERDGLRIWGRWNSNGPGSAKFFHETGLGINFDDPAMARPGDFLKIFWNNEVGKNERGHTVIFLGYRNGSVTFWGSSRSTNGYGVKTVSRSEYSKLLFSRLLAPENAINIATLDENDEFLASMLTRISSWAEVREVSGF
jgi:hypothetical protein